MDMLYEPAAGVSRDVLLAGAGPMAVMCVQAAARLADQGIGVTVVDPRWVKPVDPALAGAAAEHRLVVTVEDNGCAGGFGDAFARAARLAGRRPNLHTLSLPQRFQAHGERSAILAEHGLDPAGIQAAVRSALAADLLL
jgi:1-deoxy-D-xylulose-5-phosphate synthase